ncbi:type IV secretion system DNA-binding domain-containing protein [Candidatus Kaiserbacteria bacterium]|nr:MAG: type IV secretion system DNA-binding domain-containing protein [Candidatus Kaiserbacteria bacterium]
MDDNYEYDPQRVVYFGATDSRNKQIPFGIRALDRMRHTYVIGKTGMGKSTLLENMAIQDIQNGEGVCFIDPHGSTAEKLLEYVPESRIKDVVYFAPFDIEYPIGFNVMEDVGYDKRHLVVAGLMSSFQRIWVDAWSARMEYILQNVLLALLEYPGTTLIDVNRMLINKEFRKKVVEYVTDPIVKRFWTEEFAAYTDRYTQEATPAIQNKIGQFASNPLVRNIIAQPKSTFDIREMMDTQKIFIVNLSKGRMGEQNADLLGSMLTTKIYLAAMSRAEDSAETLAQLPPFYLYVDEFQSVVNASFANILSEARKYKLSLTIAHQYIEQVDEDIRAAIFGNVGSIITFRVGPFDAEVLKTVFEPTFYAEDLVNLGFAQIYLTLMIDGVGSKPFSAKTLPPVENAPSNFVGQIIENSRTVYSKPRAEVEKMIGEVDSKIAPGGFEKPASQWPKKKKKNGDGNGNGNDANNGNTPTQQSVEKKDAVVKDNNQPAGGKKAKKITKSKEVTPKNGNSALRDALAEITKSVKNKEPEKGNKGTVAPQKEQQDTKPSPTPIKKESAKEESNSEVSKESLEKLLNVEE